MTTTSGGSTCTGVRVVLCLWDIVHRGVYVPLIVKLTLITTLESLYKTLIRLLILSLNSFKIMTVNVIFINF